MSKYLVHIAPPAHAPARNSCQLSFTSAAIAWDRSPSAASIVSGAPAAAAASAAAFPGDALPARGAGSAVAAAAAAVAIDCAGSASSAARGVGRCSPRGDFGTDDGCCTPLASGFEYVPKNVPRL